MNASPNTIERRILVWDFPTRVFHWLLAVSFGVAYASGDSERLRDIHVIAGYLFMALIAFRLVWGLVGSRHARYSAFVRGPAAVMRYLRSLLSGRPEHHTGHNPAGAVAVVLLLALGVLTGLSGWLTFSAIGGEAFEELHEGFATVIIAIVAIHIAGVVVASRLHGENLVAAMVTGYKQGPKSEAIRSGHGIIALLLAAALATFGTSLALGKLPALYDAATPPTATERHGDHRNGKHDD